MNISYTKSGDYLLPYLILENKKQYNIGKYGLLRLNYIKKYKSAGCFLIMNSGAPKTYLPSVNKTVLYLVSELKGVILISVKSLAFSSFKRNLIITTIQHNRLTSLQIWQSGRKII